MIHWLVQSAIQDSNLARGVAPRNLLSAAEEAQLKLLKTSKRRRDWLLGRWTAKHLIQACLEQDLHLRLPLSTITIYNDAAGAPHVMAGCGTPRADWVVSISHSNGHALCAASPFSIGLGADIEHVERREWRFVEDYFTPDEISRVCCARIDLRETIVTAIWSAKEAGLKALRLGLTVDTRCLACEIDPYSIARNEWLTFTVHGPRDDHAALRGWWRVWNNYVLTIVTTDTG